MRPHRNRWTIPADGGPIDVLDALSQENRIAGEAI